MPSKIQWPIHFEPRWTLLPLRLVIGIGFLAHGLAKWTRGPAKFGLLLQQAGVPFPFHTAWLVTLLEVFGGAALAIFTVQGRYGFSSVNTVGLTPSGPVFGPPGYEINLVYIAGLLALALSVPTALSIDHLFRRS
jgi:putative oxidoreductase